MYQGQNEKSIETYKNFLTMSNDIAERCQAMIYLSKMDTENKIYWLKTAIYESNWHREPRVELAQHYHDVANWQQCWKWANEALKLTNTPGDYTCSPDAWSWRPHDLASLAAWNLHSWQIP